MKIIVGLGNPTRRYQKTYHNIGFMVVDELAQRLNLKLKQKECGALVAQTTYQGDLLILAKPQTFMNLSGISVKKLAKKYGAAPEDIMVVFDDVDIPLGKLRIRTSGSAGGHNGVKNIISELYSDKFKRLRVGLRKQEIEEKSIFIKDHVLSKIEFEDKKQLEKAISAAVSALLDYINGVELERIMQYLSDY